MFPLKSNLLLFITFATFISEFVVVQTKSIKPFKKAGKVALVDSTNNDVVPNKNETTFAESSPWQKHNQQHQQQFCPQPFLAKSPPKPFPTREYANGCQMLVQPLNYTPIDETRINATQNLTIPLCFFDKQITLEISRNEASGDGDSRIIIECFSDISCSDDFYSCCEEKAKYFHHHQYLESNSSTWELELFPNYVVIKNGIIYTYFLDNQFYVIHKAESLFTKEQIREHGNFHFFISPMC